MSMLSRYKKSGGFLQLLNLIETCGPQKQEKFLNMIREEDPRWEAEIRKKMLSIQTIFSWNSVFLSEIISRLQPLTLAATLKSFNQKEIEHVISILQFGQRRNIEDLMSSNNPSPGEIATSAMRVITEVRGMVAGGLLKLDKINPELTVPDDIEEKLEKGEIHSSSSDIKPDVQLNFHTAEEANHATHSNHGHVNAAGNNGHEVEALKKQIYNLNTENLNLKRELRAAQDKLAQIKKIA